jgi:hypothetical protein
VASVLASHGDWTNLKLHSQRRLLTGLKFEQRVVRPLTTNAIRVVADYAEKMRNLSASIRSSFALGSA